MAKFKYEVGMNPPPEPGPDSIEITELVKADLDTRTEFGKGKYLQPDLMTNNGRSALIDLYEELMDAVKYLRQELEESADSTRVPHSHMLKISKMEVYVVDLLGCVKFDEENEFLQITNRAGFIRYLKALKELNNGATSQE